MYVKRAFHGLSCAMMDETVATNRMANILIGLPSPKQGDCIICPRWFGMQDKLECYNPVDYIERERGGIGRRTRLRIWLPKGNGSSTLPVRTTKIKDLFI